MKGTRPAIIIAIIVLFIGAWYMLITDSNKLENQYNSYIEEARKKAEMGIVVDADKNYMAALEMKDNYDLRIEIMDYYQKTEQKDEYLSWCEAFISKYPKNPLGYEKMATYYKEQEAYYECFDILDSAKKRKLDTETLTAIENEIYYVFEENDTSYEQVSIYASDYCAVKKEKSNWGYSNAKGSMVIPTVYQEVTAFTSSGYAPVKDLSGEIYLINVNGDKKYVDVEKKNIISCSPLTDNKMAALIDDKYCYVDIEFKVLFGKYDYATAFNNGVAAVKIDDLWYIIDGNGNKIVEKGFKDIVVDDKQMAFRNGVGFVCEDEGYYMIDVQGQRVGEGIWEEASLFMSDEPTCIKKDGKWGYIDTEGNILVEPQYSLAKPFVNGLAAVCVNGKWGYISKNDYKLVIPAEYNEAMEFNSGGRAFVKKNDIWHMIRLCRLNSKY